MSDFLHRHPEETTAKRPSRIHQRFERHTAALLCLLLALAGVYAFTYTSHLHPNRPAIRSDGEGYYAYLPLYLIRHTLDFQAVPASHRGFFIIQNPTTGRQSDIYPLGTALCEMPFFVVAHLVTLLSGNHSPNG